MSMKFDQDADPQVIFVSMRDIVSTDSSHLNQEHNIESCNYQTIFASSPNQIPDSQLPIPNTIMPYSATQNKQTSLSCKTGKSASHAQFDYFPIGEEIPLKVQRSQHKTHRIVKQVNSDLHTHEDNISDPEIDPTNSQENHDEEEDNEFEKNDSDSEVGSELDNSLEVPLEVIQPGFEDPAECEQISEYIKVIILRFIPS